MTSKSRHLAPPFGGKMTYRKVILPRVTSSCPIIATTMFLGNIQSTLTFIRQQKNCFEELKITRLKSKTLNHSIDL